MKAPSQGDVAVAAILALPFAAYLGVALLVTPPSAAHWRFADPILVIATPSLSSWLAVLMAPVVGALWWWCRRPDKMELRRGMIAALVGAAVVSAGVIALRWASGATLPGFVPPEESAGPGIALSMSAGLLEEVVCRLLIAPALYFVLARRLRPWLAGAIAVVVTSVLFALWHAAGEGDPSMRYFITRFAIPGCFMGAVWFVNPSAVVVGHSTAHLLIPWLFALSPE